MDCISLMNDMNLNPDDILKNNVFPPVPFLRGAKARVFFKAVKDNNLEQVRRMINAEKWIIYEYDHMKKSALHWAARRNYLDIIQILLENGAQVDKLDVLGCTPLFYAAKYHYLRAVKMFLSWKAKPGIKNN